MLYIEPNPVHVKYRIKDSEDHILYVLIATKNDTEWRMLFMSEQDYRNEANQFMKMGWSCKLHMATAEIIIDMIQQGAPEVQFK